LPFDEDRAVGHRKGDHGDFVLVHPGRALPDHPVLEVDHVVRRVDYLGRSLGKSERLTRQLDHPLAVRRGVLLTEDHIDEIALRLRPVEVREVVVRCGFVGRDPLFQPGERRVDPLVLEIRPDRLLSHERLTLPALEPEQ
jgi:hypothetical protein